MLEQDTQDMELVSTLVNTQSDLSHIRESAEADYGFLEDLKAQQQESEEDLDEVNEYKL